MESRFGFGDFDSIASEKKLVFAFNVTFCCNHLIICMLERVTLNRLMSLEIWAIMLETSSFLQRNANRKPQKVTLKNSMSPMLTH